MHRIYNHESVESVALLVGSLTIQTHTTFENRNVSMLYSKTIHKDIFNLNWAESEVRIFSFGQKRPTGE